MSEQLKELPIILMDQEEKQSETTEAPSRCVKPPFLSTEVQGSILVLFSAFIFSIMTFFVDAAGEKGIPSFEMMAIRCVIQMVYSGISCLIIGINPFGTSGNRKLPVLRGIFGPLATGALYYGATQISMADATVLKFTSPIWTLLIARVVLGETISLSKVAAVTIGFIGVMFVVQPKFLIDIIVGKIAPAGETDPEEIPSDEVLPGTTAYALVVLICLGGAVCSSIVYVIVKKSGGSVHFQVLLFYYGLLGIFSSSILLVLFQGYPVIFCDWETYLYLLIISICGCIAQTAFNKGGQMISATKTAVFRSTDVAFVLTWQIIFIHEIPTYYSIIGMALICTCTVLIALCKSKQELPVDQIQHFDALVINGEAEDELSFSPDSKRCDVPV